MQTLSNELVALSDMADAHPVCAIHMGSIRPTFRLDCGKEGNYWLHYWGRRTDLNAGIRGAVGLSLEPAHRRRGKSSADDLASTVSRKGCFFVLFEKGRVELLQLQRVFPRTMILRRTGFTAAL